MGDTLFAFTNDDAGMNEPELFAELLDFLKAQQVPATFFVVPRHGDVPLDQKPAWVDLLHRALDEGHDSAASRLRPQLLFRVRRPALFHARHPRPRNPGSLHAHAGAVHAASWLRPSCVTNWRRARDPRPRLWLYPHTASALRVSPCATTPIAPCATWTSAGAPTKWSTRWAGATSTAITIAANPGSPASRPTRIRYKSGLLEAPMHSEYTWYLAEGDVDRHFELAKADYDRTRAEGGAFVVLSHYYAMTGQWATGKALYAAPLRLCSRAGRRAFRHPQPVGGITQQPLIGVDPRVHPFLSEVFRDKTPAPPSSASALVAATSRPTKLCRM